jgi:hypothetical protein
VEGHFSLSHLELHDIIRSLKLTAKELVGASTGLLVLTALKRGPSYGDDIVREPRGGTYRRLRLPHSIRPARKRLPLMASGPLRRARRANSVACRSHWIRIVTDVGQPPENPDSPRRAQRGLSADNQRVTAPWTHVEWMNHKDQSSGEEARRYRPNGPAPRFLLPL